MDDRVRDHEGRGRGTGMNDQVRERGSGPRGDPERGGSGIRTLRGTVVDLPDFDDPTPRGH